jgi:hypothetical protein
MQYCTHVIMLTLPAFFIHGSDVLLILLVFPLKGRKVLQSPPKKYKSYLPMDLMSFYDPWRLNDLLYTVNRAKGPRKEFHLFM